MPRAPPLAAGWEERRGRWDRGGGGGGGPLLLLESMGDIYCVLGKLRDVSPILHPLVEISLKVPGMNYMYFSKRKRLKVATSM
jgi:hypothetical protein